MKLSDTNLFSGFTKDIENGFCHLDYIFALAKKFNKKAEEEYQQARKTLANNYIYHIMHDHNISNRKKLQAIKTLSKKNRYVTFCHYKVLLFKERLRKSRILTVRLNNHSNGGN